MRKLTDVSQLQCVAAETQLAWSALVRAAAAEDRTGVPCIDFWESSVIANKLCPLTNHRENNAELGFICILVHGHARDRGVFSPAECFRWEQCCVFAGNNNAVALRGTMTGSFPEFGPHLQALGVDHTHKHICQTTSFTPDFAT